MSQSHFPSHPGSVPPASPQNVVHQLQPSIVGHTTTPNNPTLKTPNVTTRAIDHHHTTFILPHGSTGHHQQQQQSSFLDGQQQQQQLQSQHPQFVLSQKNELTRGSPKPQSAAVVYQQQQQPVQKIAVVQSQIQPNVKSRKLQVDDALSYLEKVRQQFSNDPQVYNDFLEVMKEFKSHTIDTNGVIRRVSQLFQAYPELIDGFNTFLPHGYEVRVHGSHIFIFEPNGSSSMINNSFAIGGDLIEDGMELAVAAASPQIPLPSSSSVPTIQSHSVLKPNTAISESPTGIGQSVRYVHVHTENPLTTIPMEVENEMVRPSIDGGSQRISQEGTQSQQKVLSCESEHNIQNQQPQQPTTKTGQLIHFSEALGYLNRIKGRFADRPDVYREFLNILGNYQQCEGDQKWSEAEVYQRVSRLFHNELDLMRDFKSFLPDAKLDFTEHQNEQQKPKLEEEGKREVMEQKQKQQKEQQQQPMQTAQNTKPTAAKSADTVHKRQFGKEQANLNAKKAKTSVNKITYDVGVAEILEEIPLRDFVIFEKIHRALQSETIFENFMRTLVMYNKSLVSRSELVDLITPFLAEHPELLKQFKDILGGQTAIGAHSRKHRPLEERLPRDLAEHIDYNTCKQHGVSYRCLPEDGTRSVCSGRTVLCNQVLNDSYVSFPKWSSEDSAPISSKKSPYEDLMYRTEDERFEVDIFIEVNSAAITALECARRKIESMGHEDAKKFMSEEDLGCSPTFLTRAVKKLYGEHGGKILFALKENPLVAVPMVLRRLREKDVECRGLRKEYNEIWRDQVEKNYLKSLDHQALTFKANDLKDIRSKGFIQQLENIYTENLQKAIASGESEADFGPQVAIEYPPDPQVFHETNELLLHYIKRQPNIPKREKAKIKEVLHSIIPKLFMLHIEMAFADNEEVEETSEKSGDESETTSRGDEKPSGTDEGAEEGERQPILSARQRRGRQRRQSVDSCGTSQRKESGERVIRDGSAASAAAPFSSQCVVRLSTDAHRLAYVMFYGTNPWVLFIRLHAIMCDRLAKIKRRTEELVEEYHVELAIRERQKKLFEEKGDSVEAQLMNAVDVHLGLRDLKKPLQNPENFYQIMLQEMKNLLDGQVDASKFEDTLRSMFDTRAYVLFTMDKLVNTLVRQLQNFVGDSASGQCVEQFEKYFDQRVNGCESGQPAARVDKDYSEAMEKVLLNQHCFKMFFFNREHPVVTIELIDTDETESEEEEEEEESANVVALHNWKHFLKDEGCDLDDDSLPRKRGWKSGQPKFLARNVRYRRALAKLLQCNFASSSVAGQSPAKNNSEEPTTNKILHFYVSNGFILIPQLRDVSDTEMLSDTLIRKCRNRKSFRKKSIANTKKFNIWLDKFHKDDTELSARWMTTGCTSRPCQHHEFKFLRFNIYSSKSVVE
ncbi:hypothetical protein niasHS_010070 [Heterodera schachtii]|uniref:Histone deacetylase interacting domain-containing protein n=1 Tax=Heterodera schachtii TaxID=97005 RepID=A0ABD2J4F7_HETSC